MKTEEQVTRLLELQTFIFAFTEIDRFIYFPDSKATDRRENNTEHSFSLALAAWFLSQHYPHLDTNLCIRYALVHDLVEVHAGDEQAIGRSKEAQKKKEAREHEAFLKLKSNWHDFPEMISDIAAYEQRQNAESKFVYALDKIMPLLLNLLSDGKTWKKYNFKRSDILRAKDSKITVSPEVNEIWQHLRSYILTKDDLFAEGMAN